MKPAQCCIKLVFHLTYTVMHVNTKLKHNGGLSFVVLSDTELFFLFLKHDKTRVLYNFFCLLEPHTYIKTLVALILLIVGHMLI